MRANPYLFEMATARALFVGMKISLKQLRKQLDLTRTQLKSKAKRPAEPIRVPVTNALVIGGEFPVFKLLILQMRFECVLA